MIKILKSWKTCNPVVVIICISISFLLSATTVSAVQSQPAISWLKVQGLIKGSNGDLMLDNPLKRGEAAILVVRIIGQEEDLNNLVTDSPFRDVPVWAMSQVNYLYQNKITYGISVDSFGSNELVSAQQYATFLLRALGYGADFTYENVFKYAVTVGLLKEEELAYFLKNPFLRQQAAEMTFSALLVRVKGKDTLAQELFNQGILSEQAYKQLPIRPEDMAVLSGTMKGPLDTRRYWRDYFSKISYNMDDAFGSISIPANIPIWFGKMLNIDIDFYLNGMKTKAYSTIVPEYRKSIGVRYVNAGVFTKADAYDELRYIISPVTQDQATDSLSQVMIVHKVLADKEAIIQEIMNAGMMSYTVSDESATLPDWRSVYMLKNMNITTYPDGTILQAYSSPLKIDPISPPKITITEGIGDLSVTESALGKQINISVTREDLIQCITLYNANGEPSKYILMKP